MKSTALSLLLFCFVLSCAKQTPDSAPVSVKGEKLYAIRGRIVSKATGKNTIELDHEAIPGFMEAMTMAYSVRGGNVTGLPPDESRIEAKLHVTDDGYWLTDVKRVP